MLPPIAGSPQVPRPFRQRLGEVHGGPGERQGRNHAARFHAEYPTEAVRSAALGDAADHASGAESCLAVRPIAADNAAYTRKTSREGYSAAKRHSWPDTTEWLSHECEPGTRATWRQANNARNRDRATESSD